MKKDIFNALIKGKLILAAATSLANGFKSDMRAIYLKECRDQHDYSLIAENTDHKV